MTVLELPEKTSLSHLDVCSLSLPYLLTKLYTPDAQLLKVGRHLISTIPSLLKEENTAAARKEDWKLWICLGTLGEVQ